MKKLTYVAIFLILVVLLSYGAIARSTRSFSIPKDAVKLSDEVYDLGTKNVNGEQLQGYVFVHYKKNFAKNVLQKGVGTTCYAFLSSGARWKNTESYVLDTYNNDGMSPSFVESVVATSLDTWDVQVPFKIFGGRDASKTVDGADTAAPDNKNEIMFRSITDPGVIAVTTTWGIFGGNPLQRRIVEFDAVFDDDDFKWGDAALNPALMDFQDIATHELGHAAGMGHPSNTCTEETMYAYATEGETKKRNLNSGDIAGIKKLYK